MNNPVSDLEAMAAAAIANKENPTSEDIRALIQSLCSLPMFDLVTEEAAELLARQFEEKVSVVQNIGSVLTDTGHNVWLPGAKALIDPFYWERYRKHLIQEGLPPNVVVTLDEVTDRILGLLQDPSRTGSWDRRGLVVGHVQSGKTANYNGLICKAADAGYKLIVVIAGVHNNLRSQTQRRVDEGFVGRDSARLLSRQDDMFVGVGNFDHNRRPVTFTNTVRDFNKATATGVGIPLQNLTEPAVFVIKKNSSTLKNLVEWLREHSGAGGTSTIDEPMLLIDDEADNASINIKHGAGEVSRINGQLRELLSIFSRSCYVGYTATPFANIFIDPDTYDDMVGEELFPRSFIVSLDPPSNYFGASTVFLEQPDQYIRSIEDNQDRLPLKHTQGMVISSLPQSLKDAVRAFIVARAIRLLRGHPSQHCSMLVNASRFLNVQSQLRTEIHAFLSSIQASARVNGELPVPEASNDPEIASLRETWEREYSQAGYRWSEVQSRLHQAAAPIIVAEINSRSPHTLDYAGNQQDGLNVIAVGGFSLSRGLTLEGLMVSYFLRNSIMYDTLMQMGRWFGYRPGYEDLCRIWMPEEAAGWYEHIAESTEELRNELRSMEASNATPADFGLKVRSHPDTLVVTARNKMGSGERVVVTVGLAGRLLETHLLRRESPVLASNRNAARNLVDRLEQAGFSIQGAIDDPSGFLLQKTPVGPVLEFLREYNNHDGSLRTYGDPIRQYIETRSKDELSKWDVLFASLRENSAQTADNLLGRTVYCQQRTEGRRSDPRTLYIGNRQRVSSRGIERSGLTEDEVLAAEKSHREALKQEGKSIEGPINYPDRAYRSVRKRPLLVVHLIDVHPLAGNRDLEKPVVAWSISFPRTEIEETPVQYVVNTTWLRENYSDDMDEDEMGGDDI